MKEKSWVCTVFTQLILCIALFIALNIGESQKRSKNEGRVIDVFFVSVDGGFRPLEEQTLLLKQMEKVVKSYRARFIVTISELGESDPLLKNATQYPELQKIPWYTTGALKGGGGANCFLKKIEIPYGQTLDIIALNTGLLQDSSSVPENEQLQWLTTTLNESSSNWEMVNGFLLHRVSPLEIVTHLVKLTGEVVQSSALQQMGKEVM
ncbi:Hypothetical predicted protein [Olea europaea subsp. europaea]|uniref:Uncharacterized protein n=1 Tax=Olea europaea subsp. europaea TaxID=158383 RepID=A0A8S0U546_OLEEU|nr:Hypothetical predicted protein [Olea europaea subsp. europaea]